MTATQVQHPTASRSEWVQARLSLLAAEKELTQKRDELSRQRRELPWVHVDQNYVFAGPNGPVTLADLFGNRRQLIVYHFMFGPNWEEGCKSCSLVADHFDPMLVHLAHRDVSFAVVSRAPLERIAQFQQRMDWRFTWVSAAANSFQHDYGVHFTPEELQGEVTYNYKKGSIGLQDAPGLSVFYKDDSGTIFHTYSTYARGLDPLVGTYQFLDLVPKGRDEDNLAFSMAWLRHHDKYDETYVLDPAARYQQPREVETCCNAGKQP